MQQVMSDIRRSRNIPFSNLTVAAAGSTLATGTVLNQTVSNVTGATGANGVTLPPIAVNIGSGFYVVINANASNALLVYPPSTTVAFNGGTAGNSFSVAANKMAIFFVGSTTNIGAITA